MLLPRPPLRTASHVAIRSVPPRSVSLPLCHLQILLLKFCVISVIGDFTSWHAVANAQNTPSAANCKSLLNTVAAGCVRVSLSRTINVSNLFMPNLGWKRPSSWWKLCLHHESRCWRMWIHLVAPRYTLRGISACCSSKNSEYGSRNGVRLVTNLPPCIHCVMPDPNQPSLSSGIMVDD